MVSSRAVRLGHPGQALDPEHIDYDALVAYYEEYQNITVAARTDRDFILHLPGNTSDSPYTAASLGDVRHARHSKPSWRAAHARQVLEIMMELLNSPLAHVARVEEDLERKTQRLVPD